MSNVITMKQISKISGYSISTVSKALKNKNDISLKTKIKIKALANSYNYIPNNSAAALRSRKTNTIAVVVPNIDNLIYSSFLNSIQDEAFKIGYHVILQQYLNCKNGSYTCLQNLRDGSVDGIIIIQPLYARVFSDGISQLSDVKYYPTIIYTIENPTQKLKDYKISGKKIVKSLFLKIGSKNKELTFETN